MMDVWPALVHLLELRHRMPQPSVEDQAASLASHLLIKGEFGAGKQATATLGSSTEAKPRVIVWGKLVDTSLSPTFAGRDATSSKL
jgi:hypothetical protein